MRSEMTARPTGALSWARGIAALFGIWLIISPFAWRHTSAQTANAVICGVLAIVFAIASIRDGRARHLNSVLGLWLILSTFILGAVRVASSWNELVVGFALIALSLVRGTSDETLANPPPGVSKP